VFFGFSLSLAVEGFVIAYPIYRSTKSRLLALALPAVAALAEVVGGAIGHALLTAGGFSGTAFGVMFGLVCGLIVFIVTTEFLPSAYEASKGHSWILPVFLFVGMALIAITLLVEKL
jgi:zinc transporter, ZIP family